MPKYLLFTLLLARYGFAQDIDILGVSTGDSATYTIKDGDTFHLIAKSLGINLTALMNENAELDPLNLQAGQVIRLPGAPVSTSNPEPKVDPAPVVGDHKSLIRKALQLAGVPATDSNINSVNTIIEHESRWDPRSINKTDMNAAAGDPSRGLMQTIGETFRKYALPGLSKDIYEPLSNIVAGVRYAVARYGSLQKVPGVASLARGGSYLPY